MRLAVITRVATEGIGNLALPVGIKFTTGVSETTVNAPDALGPAWLAMRAPVFDLGEILVIGPNDRDALGRKPDKWDVDVEYFNTVEEAWARSQAVIDEAPVPA